MTGVARASGLESLVKTGTTEIGEGHEKLGLAWFAGWAPADDPKVIIVVQLESEGSGGSTAAPVARAPGEHLLEFGGKICDEHGEVSFETSATYHLHVEGTPEPD